MCCGPYYREPRLVRLKYVVLVWVLLCVRVEALDRSLKVTQYAHAAWSQEESRLPGRIWTLAQTRDGNLWLGTETGLFRFDGIRFFRWEPPKGEQLASEYITSLAAARDGSLWIGTQKGLSHWKDGNLEAYGTTASAAAGISAIFEDRNGTVWVGAIGYNGGGLCRVTGKLLECYGGKDGLPGAGVYSVFEDREGNLWTGGEGGVCRWKPGAPHAYRLHKPGESIYSVAEDRQGEIVAATVGQEGVLRVDKSGLVPYAVDLAKEQIRPSSLLLDRDGGLWIGTWGLGLLHVVDGRIDRYTHADGLSNDVVWRVFEDHEGDIWVATTGGLDRFREFAVTRVSRREGLTGSFVNCVLAARSGVWIGTEAGLNRVDGGSISVYGQRDGLPSARIFGLFEERSGRLWVASGERLLYFEQGRFHALEAGPQHKTLTFIAAAEDGANGTWLSDPKQGLMRLVEGRVTEVRPWSQFDNKIASALGTDRTQGGLWLGFVPEGVAYMRPDGSVRWYTTADGLEHAGVSDLQQTPDGSLWIATASGLSRLKNGNIATLKLKTADGVPCESTHSIAQDDDGALWLNTACGIIHIAQPELARWASNPGSAEVKFKLYDARDGARLRSLPSGNFPRASGSGDGRLWFADADGAEVVNAKHLPNNQVRPPVEILQITADHVNFPLQAFVSLPPLTKDLEVDYTALSFVIPERVRFRYRLEGFDANWQDVKDRRYAVYTNLPPRRYRFQVIASNNDGVWNDAGASFELAIRPAFHQTALFFWCCVVAAVLAAWGLYRWRVHRVKMAVVRSMEERYAERTRIANELHDDLLQNLSGTSLLLEGVSKIVTKAPEEARQRILELRWDAEQWLRDARETIWDLRSRNTIGKDFLAALREVVSEFANVQSTQVHLKVEGQERPVPPESVGRLHRIVREATRNAVRHSGASAIRLNVSYMDPERLSIQIIDNGCGFDPEEGKRKTGHWGLATMRERAEAMGGEFRIASSPGQGTKIEITVPIKFLTK